MSRWRWTISVHTFFLKPVGPTAARHLSWRRTAIFVTASVQYRRHRPIVTQCQAKVWCLWLMLVSACISRSKGFGGSASSIAERWGLPECLLVERPLRKASIGKGWWSEVGCGVHPTSLHQPFLRIFQPDLTRVFCRLYASGVVRICFASQVLVRPLLQHGPARSLHASPCDGPTSKRGDSTSD